MIRLILIFLLLSSSACGYEHSEKDDPPPQSQKRVGGRCEGCAAIYEHPQETINAVDTLPDFNQDGPKMIVHGRVLKPDGKTPAPNVLLYIYHTDQTGVYPKKGNEKGWARRHGYLRGWIRTNEQGEYTFYTLKPGSYPSGNAPAHIHVILKEPDPEINEYFVGDFLFEGDPNLRLSQRQLESFPGGSGVIQLTKREDGLLNCKRDIILGKNIENYPSSKK